jgi:hypothetical protein
MRVGERFKNGDYWINQYGTTCEAVCAFADRLVIKKGYRVTGYWPDTIFIRKLKSK